MCPCCCRAILNKSYSRKLGGEAETREPHVHVLHVSTYRCTGDTAQILQWKCTCSTCTFTTMCTHVVHVCTYRSTGNTTQILHWKAWGWGGGPGATCRASKRHPPQAATRTQRQYVCVCMRACMHACMCAGLCMHACMHACTLCVCTYVCMHLNMHSCMHVYTCIKMHLCMHVYYIYSFVPACVKQ